MNMHPRMIYVIFLVMPLLASVGLVFLLFKLFDSGEIVELYRGGIRDSLFAGFLTVGGFLLSMKTFILISMKRQVYDSKEYVDQINERRSLNKSLTHYGPLERLGNFLFYSVLFALIAAACQLTFGLSENPLSIAVALVFAMNALILMLVSLVIIKQNMSMWYGHIEKSSPCNGGNSK
ncbi:MAG: hypothetical protein Q8K97_07605 [Pseudohongiella sp.]|nr:hypothetical protein [Pseudohongiella sp.]